MSALPNAPTASSFVRYLSDEHRRALEDGSNISPEVIAARGYLTVRNFDELIYAVNASHPQACMTTTTPGKHFPNDRDDRTLHLKYGTGEVGEDGVTTGKFTPKQLSYPALVIPTRWGERGVVGHRIRPDNPRTNGDNKPMKYVQPTGLTTHLDVNPLAWEALLDPGQPLCVTEGEKKGDALWSAGVPTIALTGVFNWQEPGTDELKPEWDDVPLEERDVFIVFDSDVMTNEQIQTARWRLTNALRDRGARVLWVTPPGGSNGSKVGIDDYLASGGTWETLRVGTTTEPRRPDHVTATPRHRTSANATDHSAGEAIARYLVDKVLWVPELGKGDDRWCVYDPGPGQWTQDTGRSHDLLITDLMFTLRESAREPGVKKSDAQTMKAVAQKLASAGGRASAKRFAEPLLHRSLRDFDLDPGVLNSLSGVIVLKTGELREHRPIDYLMRCSPSWYDPNQVYGEVDPVWWKAVSEAFEGDEDRIRVFQRFCGYSLTGHTWAKKLLVLHGPGDTAKSTLVDALFYALGNSDLGGYATLWDAEVIQANSKVNRAEKLDKARGARMLVVGELAKGSRMADHFVKRITGPHPTVDARAMYGSSYSYSFTAKLWLDTNYVSHSADPQTQTRSLLLPARHVLTPDVKDQRIKDYLDEDPSAHSAVLAWAMRGCLEWQQDGFGPTPWLDTERERWLLASDDVARFIAEELVLDESLSPPECALKDEVWKRYLWWAPSNTNTQLHKGQLTEALSERGLVEAKLSAHWGLGQKMVWRGVQLAVPD